MHAGQKVVCIDDSFPKPLAKYYEELPKKGKTYTVRAVYTGRPVMHFQPGQRQDGEVGLLLMELINPPDMRHKDKAELGFNANRFITVEAVEAATEEDRVVAKLAGQPPPSNLNDPAFVAKHQRFVFDHFVAPALNSYAGLTGDDTAAPNPNVVISR